MFFFVWSFPSAISVDDAVNWLESIVTTAVVKEVKRCRLSATCTPPHAALTLHRWLLSIDRYFEQMENQVQSFPLIRQHQRMPTIMAYDRQPMIFCLCLIVTIALPVFVMEILTIHFSRSRLFRPHLLVIESH